MNFAWAVFAFRKGSHFRTGLGGLLNAPQDVPSAAPWALVCDDALPGGNRTRRREQ